jgi:uncharacterized membrane protein YbjE (DUF340 family)
MKASIVLAAVVGAGILAGRGLSLAGWDTQWVPVVENGVLFGLMALVGILLGADEAALGAVRKAGPGFLLVPLAIALGSVLAGALMAPLAGLPVGQSAAVGGGFGWYSLSGVLLTNIGYPQAGALALLANVLRELVALTIIPTIARHWHPWQTLAPAGATATDVTRPIIMRSAGTDMGMLAAASGGLLSLAVPFVVPLLARLGG